MSNLSRFPLSMFLIYAEEEKLRSTRTRFERTVDYVSALIEVGQTVYARAVARDLPMDHAADALIYSSAPLIGRTTGTVEKVQICDGTGLEP